MVYVIQIITVLGLSKILCFNYNNRRIENGRTVFIFLVFLYCFILMAFRDVSVGVDTQTYANYYAMVSNIPWKELLCFDMSLGMEWGYTLFMKVCSIISNSYYFFQVIYSIIFCYLSAKFIDRFAYNELTVVICFLGMGLYTAAFNVQRQMLAVMILANSFWHIKNGRKFMGILMCLVATSIHQTSIVFLIAYIVYLLRHQTKLIKLIPIVILFAIMKYNTIIGFASRYFPYYNNYYKNYKTIQSAGGIWIIWIVIVTLSLIQMFSRTKRELQGDEDKYDIDIYSILSLVFVGCNIMGLYFNYFERLGQYFMPFVPILFDRFSLRYNGNMRLAYTVGVIASFTAYHLLSCFTGRALGYSFFL